MDLFLTSRTYKLIVACSGGPDSMYLLDRLRRETQHSIYILHINHGIRTDAHIDEDIVKKYGNTHKIPTIIEKIDIQTYKDIYKTSIETASRIARKEHLEQARKKYNADWITTAHHLDDQVETLLYRLIRGTKLHGLIGIPRIRGAYIRPLLHISKYEILEYIQKHHIVYATDSTNSKNTYDRNRIRNTITMNMEKINTKYRENIVNISKYAISLESYLESIFLPTYQAGIFKVIWYTDLHPFLRKEWIRYIYEQKNDGTIGLSEANITEMDRYILTARGKTQKQLGELMLTKKQNNICIR